MIKINIGCGWRNFGDDWIHVDGGDYPHLNSDDIYLYDYKQGSADLIYASHVIEYFDRNEVIILLKRWGSILKPGGVLRIAVPDFGVMANLYVNKSIQIENILGPLYGKMVMGDETIYHKTTYDFDSLKLLLEDLGMNGVRRYNWRKTSHSEFDDHSQAYIPHMDKDNGVLISLNVECVK